MDVRQLRYFVRIVEAGGISRAAGELNISQSALSLHVTNLEHELGVRLLLRGKRGVTPTDCGQILVNRALSILSQLDNAVQEIRSYAADPAGKVSLGLPASIAEFFCPPLLMQIKSRYPNISLRIVDGVSQRLLSWVQESRIDLALAPEIGSTAALGVERLLAEKLHLVGAGPRRFGRASGVKAANLASMPLILPGREHGIRLIAEDLAAKLDIDLLVKFEVDALPAIKELVRAQFGYTLLPEAAIKQEMKRGELWAVELTDPPLLRHIALLRPLRAPATRAADAVRHVIMHLVVKMVRTGEWPATLLVDKEGSLADALAENLDWL